MINGASKTFANAKTCGDIMTEDNRIPSPDRLVRLATGTTAVISGITFLSTIVAVAGLPFLGAVTLGYLGAKAAVGAGLLLQTGAAVAGAVAGGVAGAVPLAVLGHFGKKKDPSYGMLELLCVPAAVADRAVSHVFKKIGAVFNRSASRAGKNAENPTLSSDGKPPAPKP